MHQPLDPAQARSTYEAFAPFYDRFTHHHDYETWTASLERLARRHGLRGRRLLDVACGTGKSFLPMLARGYEVAACDSSPAMLARAAAKCSGRARLFVADMRHLPSTGPFDLVTCLDEPLNYLLEDSDLLPAFASVRRNLAPGGLYVFDVNTIHAYRSIFGAETRSGAGDLSFVWRGEAEGSLTAGSLASATIDVFSRDGGSRRLSSRHRQRHHPGPLLRRHLRSAGLECVAVYGQVPDGSIDEGADEARHTKAVYVARRA